MQRHPVLRRPPNGPGAFALAATLCVGLPVLAQTPSADPQSIVVTATRTPVQAAQALAEVTVLDRADIEAATGLTLAQMLAREAGLQAWSSGGLGKVASLSVRGLEARHTLLLIDGVRHGSATVGTPTLDNLPLQLVDRIEIVRGPLSALYGSDAVGGVIQVFTRGGTRGVATDATATVGPDRYRSLAGGIRVGTERFDGAVQVQTLRNRGFSDTNERVPFGAYNPDRDGFDQDSTSAQLGLNLPRAWRAQWQSLLSRGRSQFDDGPGADARARLLSTVHSLQAVGPVTERWNIKMRASRSIDDYDIQASASPFTELGVIGTEQQQLGWENTVSTPAGTLLLLAERLTQHVNRPGAAFAVSRRRIDGLAAGLSGNAGTHHWQAALRRDRNSQFGRQVTGSASYGYDITHELRLVASAGTSFNAPSFNQLYYPGFGNPALQPERGEHRELSARWTRGPHEARATWFASDIRGYITPGQNPVNVDADIDGIALSAATAWAGWKLSASAEWLDARNANASHPQFGKQLPRRAREVARLALERRVGAWTLGASLLRAGSRFEDLANTTRIAGYALADLRLEHALARDWHLALALNNAANRRYETVLGYNQPGRQLFVTLRHGGG